MRELLVVTDPRTTFYVEAMRGSAKCHGVGCQLVNARSAGWFDQSTASELVGMRTFDLLVRGAIMTLLGAVQCMWVCRRWGLWADGHGPAGELHDCCRDAAILGELSQNVGRQDEGSIP